MHNVYILGSSAAVLSMVLETLYRNGITTGITIVKNMATDESQDYLPPGQKVNIISSAEWEKAATDTCIFGVATPAVKQKVFCAFLQSHGIAEENFFTLHHPASTVATSAIIAAGCYTEPQTVVSPFAELGFGVTVNRGTTIGHHTIVGRFATINPGVHIGGNCRIGNGVQIGIGSAVFEKVSIGAGSVIGGGSVVTGDIPAGVLAWGSPCKVIKTLTDD